MSGQMPAQEEKAQGEAEVLALRPPLPRTEVLNSASSQALPQTPEEPVTSMPPTAPSAAALQDLPDLQPLALAGPPTKRRRGRPSKLLQEFLAQHPSATGSTSALPTLIPSDVGTEKPGVPNVGPHLEAETRQADVAAMHRKDDVIVPTVESYVPVRLRGFTLPSATAPVLLQCCRLAAEEALADDSYVKIHHAYLTPEKYHLASQSVRAGQLGLSRQALHSKLCRLVNAQTTLLNMQRVQLEDEVTRHFSSQQLVAYVDAQTYDETPMKATIKHDNVPAQHGQGASTGSQLASGASQVDGQQFQNLDTGRLEAMKVKILQTRQFYGMVLKHGHDYVNIMGQTLCPLQVMERGTAEVLKECLLRQSAVSPRAALFTFPTRLSCSDKAAYNLKAEADMVGDRAGSWQHIHTTCDVHATSTAYNKVFEGLVPSQVSGLIRCALSLREPAALHAFRRCLAEEIQSRLRILRGAPPRSAEEHRQRTMETFMSEGSSSMVVRVLLSHLPNGDWRNSSEVEYYVSVQDADIDKDHICRRLQQGLCYAMVGTQPSFWPRHRWTGADIALDELARMEAIHCLLSHTYSRFMRTYHHRMASTCDEETRLNPLLPIASLGNLPGGEGEGDTAVEGVMQEGTGPAEPSSAAEHSRNRRQAQEWLQSRPWSQLVAMRLTMEPLRQLLLAQFQTCSEEWEVHERAELLRQREDVGGPGHRRYMLSTAAKGELEQRFFDRLFEIWENTLRWNIVDEADLTCNFRALAFRMLSRAGCAVEQLIAHPHRLFPIRTFSLLDCVDVSLKAVELEQTSACVRDTWTQGLLDCFGGLAAEECLQTLHLHGLLGTTNIAAIETRHASVRRHLVSRSVQTWALQVAYASSEWMSQCLRRSKASKLASSRARATRHVKKRQATVRCPEQTPVPLALQSASHVEWGSASISCTSSKHWRVR